MNNFNPSLRGRSRYFLIGIIVLAIVAAMLFSFHSNSQIIKRHFPLVDAAMEVKLEATAAHLWFEELISGDRYEEFSTVVKHIDQAKWYARAMLEGGKNQEGTFLPLSDIVPKEEVATTIALLDQFEKVTHQRYKASSTSGVGSTIDQQYDYLFRTFIDQIDNVEALLQQKIRHDFSNLKTVQFILVVIIIALGLLVFLVQYRYDNRLRQNILEINEAKHRFEKSERWLKTTMNSMGDGVIITDHNGKVTYLNPVASSLTGWLLKDAIGKKMTEVFQIVNEITKQPVDDPVSMVIRKNVVVGLANHTELISKDGTVCPISDTAAPIFDHENNLAGVVVVFHDSTEKKKAEAEKVKMEAQLRQAFKMEAIGTMAGGIAHDFNNILTIIIGNAELAQETLPPDSHENHHIKRIMEASNNAKELVKQILSFSRDDKVQKEPFNIGLLLEENMKSLRSTIPTSVSLRLENLNTPDSGNCEELIAFVDPTQFHQLLLNLCVNAVQAMDEEGLLQITLDKETYDDSVPTERTGLSPGVYAHLAIADNGPGIVPELFEMIFDPFFTTKRTGKGTGMGLAVVHGIVESHGGKIYVESEKGNGATFHVYFPVTKQQPERKTEESASLPGGKERILFIDDEKLLAEMAKNLLKNMGYSVTAITDSVAALEHFRENPKQYDIVITDQTMPNLTGAELSKSLLSTRPDLPIILCTGYSSKINELKAKQLGIREFALKPFNGEEIAYLIRKVLDNA